MMELLTLPNGCRVVLEKTEWSKSAAICIYIGCGSRDETDPAWGASHFIEHMLFKGTEHRTALEISEQMDEIGGNLNAYTSKEYTCVYSQALEEHVLKAFDILSDMVLYPSMREKDLETEKSVILEEIGMYEDSLEELCLDRLYREVFPKSALGVNILGTKSSVQQMTSGQLIVHKERYYVPERMVISVCGMFPREELLKCITDRFGPLKNTGNRIASEPAAFHSGVIVKPKSSEQTHLVIAMPGLKIGDADRYAGAVFSTILGGSTSSRLYQRVREELGLAYSVYSFLGAHLECGILGISAAVAHHTQEETLSEIFSVTKEIRNGIDEKEFNRTREQFKSGLVMGMESHNARASAMGRSILIEGHYNDEEYLLQKLDALCLEDLYKVSDRLLDFEHAAVSVVGKTENPHFYDVQNYL